MATVTEAFDLFDKWVSDGCEYHPLLISELQGAFAEARAEVERLRAVTELKEKHRETWRDKSDSYWFARLVQEVGELGSSLVNDHDDPPEWELAQIASICLNWLEKCSVDSAAVARRAVDAEGG